MLQDGGLRSFRAARRLTLGYAGESDSNARRNKVPTSTCILPGQDGGRLGIPISSVFGRPGRMVGEVGDHAVLRTGTRALVQDSSMS